ncbi:MAG TPA: Sir2 family NAD-dependent protein deacetylase [Actinomycetota bacterium]|nr:Sir2 family NAD-dependent protein deacetylase [Actinomycetota bacterium]
MDHDIRHLARCIAEATKVVALTGAGISVDSGLGTFRDPGGLWERLDLDEVMRCGGLLGYSIAKPWEGAEFLAELRDALRDAQPNAGHAALARLERDGLLHAVVTQNVDNLHQRAGSERVVELHGSFARRRCTGCDDREPVSVAELVASLDEMIAKLGSFMVSHPAHLLRRCECGGLWRSDVVEFGEPVQGLDEAIEEVSRADVLLVCGTSCEVYPAAALPDAARARGALVVEVNPSCTELRPDVAIRRPASDVLHEIGALLGGWTAASGRPLSAAPA